MSPSSQLLINQQPVSHHRAPGAELLPGDLSSPGVSAGEASVLPPPCCAGHVSFPAAIGRVIGRFYGEDGSPPKNWPRQKP